MEIVTHEILLVCRVVTLILTGTHVDVHSFYFEVQLSDPK